MLSNEAGEGRDAQSTARAFDGGVDVGRCRYAAEETLQRTLGRRLRHASSRRGSPCRTSRGAAADVGRPWSSPPTNVVIGE